MQVELVIWTVVLNWGEAKMTQPSDDQSQGAIQPKKVLLVGWHPSTVDYQKFPGLTSEILSANLLADEAKLRALGYDARWQFLYSAQTATADITQVLTAERFDVVMIGAGVRKVEEHFLIFEQLVNVIHAHAPQTRIAFNTNPTDSAQAIQRWA